MTEACLFCGNPAIEAGVCRLHLVLVPREMRGQRKSDPSDPLRSWFFGVTDEGRFFAISPDGKRTEFGEGSGEIVLNNIQGPIRRRSNANWQAEQQKKADALQKVMDAVRAARLAGAPDRARESAIEDARTGNHPIWSMLPKKDRDWWLRTRRKAEREGLT